MAETLPRLTPGQERELVLMLQHGATSSAGAVGPYETPRVNPMVQGRLQRLELASSRVVRKPGASQFTAYWLTPAGVERARQLRRSPNG